ncbi:MAG: DUF2586 family protein [Brevinemataceae bacterium]
MWSTVNEKITDSTSGLLPNTGPIALVVGPSSKFAGKGIDLPASKAVTIGRSSNIEEIFGIGEMPRRLKDMQSVMSDCTVIGFGTEADIPGTIIEESSNNAVQLMVDGEPLGTSEISLKVINEQVVNSKNKQTGYNLGTVNFELDIKGDIYLNKQIRIIDGVYTITELGIALRFAENVVFQGGESWTIKTKAPLSSITNIEAKIAKALELYTPEFIFVAQEVSVNEAELFADWSEKLFENHKPCFFLLENNLAQEKSFDIAIADKKEEFATFDGRFVSIVCQDGYVRTSKGMERRSPSGLCAGYITKSYVNQSIGAVKEFAVNNYEFHEGWTNVHSRALDESKFITLRSYAGLQNLYWTNGRTFANNNSDYRFLEIVRTVFKAVRLARYAALPYIQAPGNDIGIQNLIAQVRNAITSMTESLPQELEHFNVSAPENQDIANSGILLDIELFGIPVIRKIQLNFMYKYQQD